MTEIHPARSDEEILRCFGVISQLRPHLVADEFLPRIRRMEADGFFLACAVEDGEARAVAGFRYLQGYHFSLRLDTLPG